MNEEKDVLAAFTAHRSQLVQFANGIVGNRASAEDVVQEAWIRIDRVTETGQIESPISYLYRIVRNLAIDKRRKNGREAAVIDPTGYDAEWVADDVPTPEDVASGKDELRLLLEALDELPEQTRIAMEMRRFGGCTLQEISDFLGVSMSVTRRLIITGVAHCRAKVRPEE